ncbi:MAG TPA: response regulator [Polyangiales bacterium]
MKVLLVDDDADIRLIASIALRQIGKWEVTTACSGSEALAKLAEATPDVVIMDLMMPDLDGLGTLAAIRERPGLTSLPVIFMTAKVRQNEVERYLAAGARGVVQKPFDPMQLATEVRRILQAAP